MSITPPYRAQDFHPTNVIFSSISSNKTPFTRVVPDQAVLYLTSQPPLAVILCNFHCHNKHVQVMAPVNTRVHACRIKAEFAQPSLVAAYRLLLAEALKDPRNTMFVLVSETCIPLHHPALFYSQLMAESHISRVGSGAYNPQRWFHLMATSHLKGHHFQKGDQWLTLTRMHAELVSTDTHVWSQFQRYCRTQVCTHACAACLCGLTL